MPITASRIFEFLDRADGGTIERYEVASADFGQLRRSLRQIVSMLRDSDDQEAIIASERLRVLLSEWLTTPVPFDRSMFDALFETLGQAEAVKARWGSDVKAQYDIALRAAEALPSTENPVREKVRDVVRELRSQGREFKIYCHRRTRPLFESLLVYPADAALGNGIFLHTLRDYRETEPGDVLIKVGPLRVRGWGSVPDALVTAPRFGTLVQIIWSGGSDEPDFGYDPVSATLDVPSVYPVVPAGDACVRYGPVKWTTKVFRSAEDKGIERDVPDEDELRFFGEMNRSSEKRPAILVQVDEEHGILFPPYSPILSFDPDKTASEPIGLRIPGETLLEGMFVVMPIVADVDLGGVRAEHGQYSQIWKTRLQESHKAEGPDLIRRLRLAGLNLLNLAGAVRNWCKPPSTVIHAPQQVKHFEILMTALGFDGVTNTSARGKVKPFWHLAWEEVRHSRGEAIQAGVQEHEIVEEQLILVLRQLAQEVRRKALEHNDFSLNIPENYGVDGFFFFFRVRGIEEGYSAPGKELKIVHDLQVLDQWHD